MRAPPEAVAVKKGVIESVKEGRETRFRHTGAIVEAVGEYLLRAALRRQG